MKNRYLIFLPLLLIACNSNDNIKEKKKFPTVAPPLHKSDLVINPHFHVSIVFSQGDTVYNSEGITAPAKGKHDCSVFIPDENNTNKGTLFIGHETTKPNDLLGDGGGATQFLVERKGKDWVAVSEKESIDFRTVGGTLANCGGSYTPNKTILSAEEIIPYSNKDIARFITDLSDFNGRPKYQNFGWMVEIDPQKKAATQKLYQMGRYKHEDALCMPDNKTVYLTNDDSCAVFFKYVADKPKDYTQGQLYAYAYPNQWLALPMAMDSLVNAREVAIRQGASLFNRQEWISLVDGKIYITETGNDNNDWSKYIAMGGKPAPYFFELRKENGLFDDPHGRLLVFDPKTNEMEVLLQGGVAATDSSTVFSNPDGMGEFKIHGKNYLIICEDIIGKNRGRSVDPKTTVNEIYLLDLSIPKPTIEDLKRLLIGPAGCEMSGPVFTPDGSTLFVNIQHPSKENKVYNKSSTIAISGWDRL